jgi:hypothetical protein
MMKANGVFTFRPKVEALEDRQLLAAQAMVVGQTLLINGDRNTNVVILNDNGTGQAGNLTGTVDGIAINALVAGLTVNRVYMNLGRGNDFVQYNVTANTNGSTMRLDAFLGEGDDIFNLGVGGNGFFLGSNYFFRVEGQDGRDTIQATMQNNADFFNVGGTSSVGMRFLGGSGDDTISLLYNGEPDGIVNFYADGGRGKDTVGAIFNIFADTQTTPGRIWAQIYGGEGDNVLGLQIYDFDANTNDTIFGLIDGGGDGRNITAVAGNVTLQNFRRNSTFYFLPQP